MRILILGAGGMLGHRLTITFREHFDTWATLRSGVERYAAVGAFDPERTLSAVDVFNFDTVVDAIAKVRPQVVINCVGIVKQLAASQDPVVSLTVNSLLPHRLHRLCEAAGARLIHFSTDCVFSGDKGMYTEDDPSDARDLYGRTKFLGETARPGALTLRTSIIGREIETQRGLVEWFLSRRGYRVTGYRRAIYSGFTTHALARILRMVLIEHPDLSGTLHVASEPISKHDLLVLIRDAYHADIEILPDDATRIDRSLDGSRFRRVTGFNPPSWPAMIEEMAADPTPYDDWRKDVHG